MKNLLLILLLITNYTLSQEIFNSKIIFGVNAGVAIDNNEKSFVEANGYKTNSLYDNNISFVELSVSSTNNSSREGKYLKVAGSVMTFKYFYRTYANDSVRTKYSGNLFGFDIYGLNFLPKQKWVDFVLSTGLNMGSKKVRIERKVKYKNWIFAPRITSELRFIVSQKFAVSAKAEAQYDITKGRFKHKKGDDVLSLEGFKYNPIMFSAGIGWFL